MKRNVTLAEISDGRLYRINDMVKADCHGCPGCSKCCEGMGKSIILDPYDAHCLTTGLGATMEELLNTALELNVVDGVILPNLKMAGERERCPFLNEEGRCGIHAFRPGICRLFPLGRYYENGSFRYFLQTEECGARRTKIKVSKWLDMPELEKNQEFVNTWHYLLNETEERLAASGDDAFQKNVNLLLLRIFYLTPWEKGDFYGEFDERVRRFREAMET